MDPRPIGVFDSGLGGLTCVTHLLRVMPKERVVYFGDTARTPYGSKGVDTIRHFSREIVAFLVEHDCKAIMIACNTVSSIALDDLRQQFPKLPIVGIIEPVVAELAAKYQTEQQVKAAVIGTKVTIESGIYPRLFQEALPGFKLASQACPLFVPLIEEGLKDHAMMDLAIHYYLDDFLAEGEITDLILGCTHYHLIQERLRRIYPKLNIFSPANAQVEALRQVLTEQGLLAGEVSEVEPAGENLFYASDLSGSYRKMIADIVQDQSAKIKFKNLSL
ncbi:MAG: glutamate racemase [Eubacteriales bacterium]|nr:glutamate racemase [Eubacteriales bacterium]